MLDDGSDDDSDDLLRDSDNGDFVINDGDDGNVSGGVVDSDGDLNLNPLSSAELINDTELIILEPLRVPELYADTVFNVF